MDIIDLPIGSEIAAALLLVLASALTIIAKRVVNKGAEPSPPLPSDASKVDLAPVIAAVEAGDRQTRRAFAVVGKQAVERLEQHDRHLAQLVQSLHENLARQHREKEIEDRRQFERVLDKVDRLRDGNH